VRAGILRDFVCGVEKNISKNNIYFFYLKFLNKFAAIFVEKTMKR
jgi:hypothetical protein